MKDLICIANDPSTSREYIDFQDAIAALEVEARNFGSRMIQDTEIRKAYIKKAKQISDEILNSVNTRKISPKDAATTVNKLRNQLLNTARVNSSDIGRSFAESLKKEGVLLDILSEKKAAELFHKNFASLSKAQQNTVYKEIVKSAGKTRPSVNVKIGKISSIGRGLILLTLAISVYNVATADNKSRAAANEGVIIGGGAIGGMAGGAAAGLLCGPGAPVCVTIGVFVGGVLGSITSDAIFDFTVD